MCDVLSRGMLDLLGCLCLNNHKQHIHTQNRGHGDGKHGFNQYQTYNLQLVHPAASEILMWVRTFERLQIWIGSFIKSVILIFHVNLRSLTWAASLTVKLDSCGGADWANSACEGAQIWALEREWRRAGAVAAAAARRSTDLPWASVQNSSTHHSGRAQAPQREDWGRKRSLSSTGRKERENSHEKWWDLDKIIRSALFMDELNF